MQQSLQSSIISDPLLSTTELHARTGVKPRTWERWRLEGKGPQFVRVGDRLVRYRLSAVEAWLRQNERAA